MKPSDLIDLLRDFYVQKLGLKRRQEAGARQIGEYDFNNTYQYVIGREDQHLAWVGDAIRNMGGTIGDSPTPPSLPAAKDDAAVFEELRGIRDGGGFGSIIGRNSFQRPKDKALAFLGQAMDIYLGKT